MGIEYKKGVDHSTAALILLLGIKSDAIGWYKFQPSWEIILDLHKQPNTLRKPIREHPPVTELTQFLPSMLFLFVYR